MWRDWYTAPLIELEPHEPSWAGEFAIAKRSLERLLAGLPILSIEHVGSTSIPDLIAKPILDIDIVINKDDWFAVLDRMTGRKDSETDEDYKKRAYKYIGEFMGADVLKREVRTYERRRNTYVCIEGSLSLRSHRDLKRILMEDAELGKEYGNRKVELVRDHQLRMTNEDRVAYNLGKNEVVTKILKKAGWTYEELKVVCKGRGGGGFYGN
ncbi:hypothetical protein BDZ45DRAFT_763909 [Acephala macrosclerotiorum]|nr:hypothetical protein BDZ45DRAFT_763909 [Acephala macrosclerotiorum]